MFPTDTIVRFEDKERTKDRQGTVPHGKAFLCDEQGAEGEQESTQQGLQCSGAKVVGVGDRKGMKCARVRMRRYGRAYTALPSFTRWCTSPCLPCLAAVCSRFFSCATSTAHGWQNLPSFEGERVGANRWVA